MNTFVRRASIAVGVAAIGLTQLPAPAQAATTCTTVASARMCVDTHWPVGSPYYYGNASITDLAGGPNLSVKVTRIKLQHFNGSSWATVRTADDFDGWHATTDSGGTTSVRPCSRNNPVFRTVATFEWKGGKAGTKTVYGGTHGHNCG